MVRGWHWGIADTIRQTDEAGISRARITDRWMAPGRPVGAGALSLVGDALHPCTPNLGSLPSLVRGIQGFFPGELLSLAMPCACRG